MSRSNVTLKDLYDVQERIEAKLDKQFKDHEDRIRSIERYQNRAVGFISLIAIFSGAIASYVWNKITGTQ